MTARTQVKGFVVATSSNGNGWKVQEVTRQEMLAGKSRCRPGKNAALFADVEMRLEQTDEGFALRYDFADKRQAKLAATAIRKRLGKRVEVFATEAAVFVARGPEWSK